MSTASLVALVISFLLALLASWLLLLPFFEERRDKEDESHSETELLARKERLLQAIEDLERDHALERLSDEQYEESRSELSEELAVCLRALDSHSKDSAHAVHRP